VTTTVGGLRDFVVHDRNALVVPPGDAAALLAALQCLLRDGERRRRLGQAARQTAIERFGAEAISDAYVALFDRVMASSAGVGSS
jgi:glycosyltransferase involved in cell wall biosynthesis